MSDKATQNGSTATETKPDLGTAGGKDWQAELDKRRLLPRFSGEVKVLLALAPVGASDEQTVKAVDNVRNQLAFEASKLDGKQDFSKAGKLGKDGKRTLTLASAKVEVTETLASRLVSIRLAREVWAKAQGCETDDVPFAKVSNLRTEVEGLFFNFGWKRPTN